jgi:hypothetical protein
MSEETMTRRNIFHLAAGIAGGTLLPVFTDHTGAVAGEGHDVVVKIMLDGEGFHEFHILGSRDPKEVMKWIFRPDSMMHDAIDWRWDDLGLPEAPK